MNATSLYVIDFTEPADALRRAGRQIARFATVIHNGYQERSSITDATIPMYRVTVEATKGAYLCLDVHTLAHSYYGVRGILTMGRDEVLCAAWMFSEGTRSRLDAGQPARCIRCLTLCEGGDQCPQHGVQVESISLDQATTALTRWVRSELPADAIRNRRPPAA